MTIAYLMNTYPITSTTFIRREIEAHERAGTPILRYALRMWDDDLVDPEDISEQEKTHYILTGKKLALLMALGVELMVNLGGLAKALGPWWSLFRKSRGGFARHFAYLLEAIYFRQQAKRDGVTHVHVHFLTNSTAVAMLAKLMGGPNYSATVHGPDELTDAPLLDFPAKIKHAEFIAAITHYCKSQIIRFSHNSFADKIKIIRCGLKLEEFSVSPVPDNRNIVCVGRLCPQKGQAQLPAAVAAICDDYPDLKVILVGDGEMRADVEREIERLNVGKHFELVGWAANAEVRKKIQESRAFLLPSYAEGLPVVIMEALALGRPVMSTYIAGIPELVDDNCGWIHPAGDHASLVSALRESLERSPDELSAAGLVGRGRVEKNHDVDQEAAKLRSLFAA